MTFKPTPGNTFTPLSGILMRTLQETPKKEDSESISDFSDSESDESQEEFYPAGEIGTKFFKELPFSSLKFINPCYWNGIRWTETGSMKLSRKYQKKEFTLISWNVWFGLRNRESRMSALGKVVREHDPDFIAFQEVTVEMLPMILNQKWAKDYFVSDTEGKFLENYGNIMLSKVAFHECVVYKLESRMGRKAMLGNFLVQRSQPIIIGTFHLESYLEDVPYRNNQIKVYRDLTGNCPNVILVGDTNFTSESEAESLGSRFKDAWRELYQKSGVEANLGLTFDTETNDMAKEEYRLQKIETPKRMRLDRCFYTHDTLEPISMEILGNEPYEGKEWISDHYGIAIKLRMK